MRILETLRCWLWQFCAHGNVSFFKNKFFLLIRRAAEGSEGRQNNIFPDAPDISWVVSCVSGDCPYDAAPITNGALGREDTAALAVRSLETSRENVPGDTTRFHA